MEGNEERDYLGSAALAATVVDDDNDDDADVVGTNVLASDEGNVAGVAETVEGGGAGGGGGYDTGQGLQQGEAAEEETEGDEQHDDDTLVGAGCGDTAALTATDELTIDAAATVAEGACAPASNLDVSDSAPIQHCTSSDHGSHGDDDGGSDHGQNDIVFAGAGVGAGTGDNGVAWASPSTSVTTDAVVSLHVDRHDDTSAPTEAQQVPRSMRARCCAAVPRIVVVLLLFSIYTLFVVDVNTWGVSVTALKAFASWLEEASVAGVLAFIGLYAVITVSGIPASILTLLGGMVFNRTYGVVGICLSFASVVVGSTMGATIAFLIGRYVLQSFVSSIVRRVKWLQALDNAFEVRGFTVVMLMRLSPAVPYNVFNYVVAGTKVTLRDFVCASVGMLPGTFSITLIGSMLDDIIAAVTGDYRPPTVHWVIFGAGVVATVAFVAVLAVVTRRQLKRLMQDTSDRDATTSSDAVTEPRIQEDTAAAYELELTAAAASDES